MELTAVEFLNTLSYMKDTVKRENKLVYGKRF